VRPIIFLSSVFLIISSCTKDSIVWNLPKDNPDEASNFKQLCQKENFETLDSVITETANLKWKLEKGVNGGRGIQLYSIYSVSSTYVKLNKKFSANSRVTYYTKFSSSVPDIKLDTKVFINNREVEITELNESESDDGWKKFQIDSIIGKGNNTIEFQFSCGGSNNIIQLDELEVFCK
jgi:hypothetical protein